VTDRRTDTAQRHRPRYAERRAGKKRVVLARNTIKLRTKLHPSEDLLLYWFKNIVLIHFAWSAIDHVDEYTCSSCTSSVLYRYRNIFALMDL